MVLPPAAAAAAAAVAKLLIKSYKERRVANFIHTVLLQASLTSRSRRPATSPYYGQV